MVDRLLYSLDLSIRRSGRVTRPELDKVLEESVISTLITFELLDIQSD